MRSIWEGTPARTSRLVRAAGSSGTDKRVCPWFLCVALALAFLFAPAAAGAFSVTLGWDSNSEPDLGGYTVYYSPTQGVPADANRVAVEVPLSSLADPADPEWTVSGLPNDRRLYFVLIAWDTETPRQESGYSNEVNAAYADIFAGVPPAKPSGCLLRSILPD